LRLSGFQPTCAQACCQAEEKGQLRAEKLRSGRFRNQGLGKTPRDLHIETSGIRALLELAIPGITAFSDLSFDKVDIFQLVEYKDRRHHFDPRDLLKQESVD
jgi:hypothetical protein